MADKMVDEFKELLNPKKQEVVEQEETVTEVEHLALEEGFMMFEESEMFEEGIMSIIKKGLGALFGKKNKAKTATVSNNQLKRGPKRRATVISDVCPIVAKEFESMKTSAMKNKFAYRCQILYDAITADAFTTFKAGKNEYAAVVIMQTYLESIYIYAYFYDYTNKKVDKVLESNWVRVGTVGSLCNKYIDQLISQAKKEYNIKL